jgi:hypothetical protein
LEHCNGEEATFGALQQGRRGHFWSIATEKKPLLEHSKSALCLCCLDGEAAAPFVVVLVLLLLLVSVFICFYASNFAIKS